jgi:hypothetical protein
MTHIKSVSLVPGLIALALCAGIDAADLTAYETFRNDNRDLPASHLANRHKPIFSIGIRTIHRCGRTYNA